MSVEFGIKATDPGESALSIEAKATNAKTAIERTTVEVGSESSDPSLEDYTGDDRVVDTADLQRGIRDWAQGKIDTDLLTKVIRAWASGNTV